MCVYVPIISNDVGLFNEATGILVRDSHSTFSVYLLLRTEREMFFHSLVTFISHFCSSALKTMYRGALADDLKPS